MNRGEISECTATSSNSSASDNSNSTVAAVVANATLSLKLQALHCMDQLSVDFDVGCRFCPKVLNALNGILVGH